MKLSLVRLRLLLLAALVPLVAIRAQSNYSTPYLFGTFAGLASGAGSVDGTSGTARFNHPASLSVDAAGNVFVADTNNDTVRKITASGVVSTFAGTAGSSGTNDGTVSAARFASLNGAAVDSAGNVYVADTYNHTIRKITSGGVVTTFAGTAGSSGSADGTGSAARFNSPFAVAVDSAGNVYVADTYNHTIRKITSGGVATTIAGTAGSSGSVDGTGSAARFYYPTGVAADSAGNIYVADTYNSTIRKITAAGVVTTLAGTAGSAGSIDATGSAARLNYPFSVAVDAAGTVFVADTYNSTIRKITAAGAVTTLAGTAGSIGSVDGTGSAARFYSPAGVTVDGAGNVYVSDSSNDTIRKISSAGVVTTLAATAVYSSADGTGAAARFTFPFGLAVDAAGNVFVADAGNDTIRKITSAGVVSTLAGVAGSIGSTDGTGSAARFNAPDGVAVDAASNVYVADTYNRTIRKITSGGVVTTLAGTAGSIGSTDGTGGAARFSFPSSVAVDAAGNVYVTDAGNDTIRKITAAGVVTTFAGTTGIAGSTDGTGSAALFNYPLGLAIDGSGNLFVADSGNSTIRKITSAGVVTTVAGTAGSVGSTDGTGIAASFNYPAGVAVDGSGNLLVADTRNDLIRKITSAGVVSTLAGATGVGGSTNGAGSFAQFDYPYGVAVDRLGKVYVADTSNNTIRITIPLVIEDFNGDGKADILWTNMETGERATWLMNGNTVSTVTSLGVVPVTWAISGRGDFNGDGKADILWTNTETGERVIWLMNGNTVSTVTSLGVVPVIWEVSGTGDFNGDGKADIFWTNTETGVRVIWLMNGDAVSTVTSLGVVQVMWEVSGTGDFNGDGKADIFWTNTLTGERATWLMNGNTVSAVTSLGVVQVMWTVSM